MTQETDKGAVARLARPVMVCPTCKARSDQELPRAEGARPAVTMERQEVRARRLRTVCQCWRCGREWVVESPVLPAEKARTIADGLPRVLQVLNPYTETVTRFLLPPKDEEKKEKGDA